MCEYGIFGAMELILIENGILHFQHMLVKGGHVLTNSDPESAFLFFNACLYLHSQSKEIDLKTWFCVDRVKGEQKWPVCFLDPTRSPS